MSNKRNIATFKCPICDNILITDPDFMNKFVQSFGYINRPFINPNLFCQSCDTKYSLESVIRSQGERVANEMNNTQAGK
jgi:hypothetical protein